MISPEKKRSKNCTQLRIAFQEIGDHINVINKSVAKMQKSKPGDCLHLRFTQPEGSSTCKTTCPAKLYFAAYLKNSMIHTAKCTMIKFSFIGEFSASAIPLPFFLFTPSDDFSLCSTVFSCPSHTFIFFLFKKLMPYCPALGNPQIKMHIRKTVRS